MNCFHQMGAAALVIALAPATVWAAGNKGLSEAQQQYRQERARCQSGESQQDRATCLKEASAAYGEARKGALSTGSADYLQNATQRCKAQPAADQEACVQRIVGPGSTSGSAEGGGIIRHTETKVR